MTHLPVPERIANQIRAKAKAEGITISAFLTRLLRENRQVSRRAATRRKRKKLSAAEIKRRMNLPHVREDTLDPILLKMQMLSLGREEW